MDINIEFNGNYENRCRLHIIWKVCYVLAKITVRDKKVNSDASNPCETCEPSDSRTNSYDSNQSNTARQCPLDFKGWLLMSGFFIDSKHFETSNSRCR